MKKQFSFCNCNLLLSQDPIKDNHRKDQGSGFAFTLGEGNDLVCKAAAFYAEQLRGEDIEELMKDFGGMFNRMSNEQQFRWLGQQKSPLLELSIYALTFFPRNSVRSLRLKGS